MDKKLFDDEVELKKVLAGFGFRFGELGCNSEYVIIFRDNKSFAPICRIVSDSPIDAIRQLGGIIQKVKLPIEDIDIQLALAFDLTSKKVKMFDDYTILSPYLYYKEKEVEGQKVIQAKEHVENEKVENTDSN